MIASGQVAFAVVAAVGASLLWQTVRNLEDLDRGFEAEGLHLVTVSLPFGFFDVPDGYRTVLQNVSDGLAARPGVVGASPTFSAPLLERGGIDFAPRLEGQSEEDARRNPYIGFDAVSPEYFSVAGTGVRLGRPLTDADGPDDEPVVVVNEAAASALWPGESPLGKRIFMGGLSSDEFRTVVGVVQDHRFRTFPAAHPSLYVPLAQYERLVPNRFLIRTTAEVDLRGLVTTEFARFTGGVEVVTAESMSEVMRRPLRRPRFAASTLLAIALVTVLLAALGVHGVLAVLVAERRKELGIRLALGARVPDVVRHVSHHVLWIAGVGTALGALLAWWAARSMQALLFGAPPSTVELFAGITAGAFALAVLAGFAPTVRAVRTDPVDALRAD